MCFWGVGLAGWLTGSLDGYYKYLQQSKTDWQFIKRKSETKSGSSERTKERKEDGRKERNKK